MKTDNKFLIPIFEVLKPDRYFLIFSYDTKFIHITLTPHKPLSDEQNDLHICFDNEVCLITSELFTTMESFSTEVSIIVEELESFFAMYSLFDTENN